MIAYNVDKLPSVHNFTEAFDLMKANFGADLHDHRTLLLSDGSAPSSERQDLELTLLNDGQEIVVTLTVPIAGVRRWWTTITYRKDRRVELRLDDAPLARPIPSVIWPDVLPPAVKFVHRSDRWWFSVPQGVCWTPRFEYPADWRTDPRNRIQLDHPMAQRALNPRHGAWWIPTARGEHAVPTFWIDEQGLLCFCTGVPRTQVVSVETTALTHRVRYFMKKVWPLTTLIADEAVPELMQLIANEHPALMEGLHYRYSGTISPTQSAEVAFESLEKEGYPAETTLDDWRVMVMAAISGRTDGLTPDRIDNLAMVLAGSPRLKDVVPAIYNWIPVRWTTPKSAVGRNTPTSVPENDNWCGGRLDPCWVVSDSRAYTLFAIL